MKRGLRSHCRRGHPFDEANTHVYRDKTGQIRRVCRKCAKMRNPFRERLYGLARADYERLVDEQHGVCALCGKESGDRALAVDHEHSSGSIRGLLCSACNIGLGAFRDDPDLLRRAIAYLNAHARAQEPDAHPILSAADREQLATSFEMLLDAFVDDIELLGAGGDLTDTLMWTFLPEAHRSHYDVRFAVKFLAATVRLQERVADGAAFPANCLGEEIALRAVLRTAISDASEFGEPGSAERLEAFGDRSLADLDALTLFDPTLNLTREGAQAVGASHLWFEDWFRPFDLAPHGLRKDLN